MREIFFKMLDKANIFNIPANYHFFESLFFWLEKNFSNDLSQAKIFLPNRRSCRELRTIFLKKKWQGALPKIKAISDISYEDFFEFLPNPSTKETIDELLKIKTLDQIDYLFFLTAEIQKQDAFGKTNFEESFKIALHIKELFDEIEREEIDLKKLDEIDDSNLAKHRQITLEFLKDFHAQIKNSLLKKNIFSATSQQNLVIKRFAEILDSQGSNTPIIIAGSTGSISSSRKLIRSISQQKNGFVVLHGWNAENYTEEKHPQFFLNQLIRFLDFEKKSIKTIAENSFETSPKSRKDLLSLMVLPFEETTKWQKITSHEVTNDLVKNFRLLEVKNEIQEAQIISQLLAKEKKSAAVITNNEKLASLVKLELMRLNISFNDARSLKIFDSQLINFLLLILEIKETDFNSHSLLALLKHPLCFYAQNKEILTEFEIKILRQERVSSGLNGIRKKIQNEEKLQNFFEDFLERIKIGGDKSISFLIKSAENLSKRTWLELLKNEPAQIEIFEFFRKLEAQSYAPSSVDNFKIILSQINYFEKSDSMSAIQILSSIEARLLNFNLVIIASLNEGDFPAIEAENWLGKKIKKDLGIDRSAKKIGQSAYDFCNYLSNKSIILTRCRSRNGALLIESPLLLKFKTICQKIGAKLPEVAQEAQNNNVANARKSSIPNPKPKQELRPQKFSITEISKLISDPYAIYAKKILQLRELQKIDFEAGYSEFGSFVHKALEEFIKNPKTKIFDKIFEKYFCSEEAKLIWWPKFENIFSDFLQKNDEFAQKQNLLEMPVKLTIGKVFLSGKIDRVIIDKEKNAEIFDYKTGEPPATKNVISGIEPQLTIAALALVCDSLKDYKISSLNYWKLSSSKEGEIRTVTKKPEEIENLISATKLGLERLFTYFADEKNGYVATINNNKSEYKNLARVGDLKK